MNKVFKITIFFIGGIILFLCVMFLVANLVIGKIASNKLTHILKERIEKKKIEAPVSFADLSINPLMGEIALTDLSIQATDTEEQAFRCETITFGISPVDVVSLIRSEDKGGLKDMDITIEGFHFIHSASQIGIDCNEIRLKFKGHITQKALGSLGHGDFTPLLTEGQKIGVSASDSIISLPGAMENTDFPEEVRKKGLSIHTALLDITSIPAKRQIRVKSEKIISPLWSGVMDVRIEVNEGDIEASEIRAGKIILRDIHEDLRPVFERLEEKKGRKLLRKDNSVVAEITGTLGNPQLVFK